MRGRFLVFEGVDGSGKTTQARRLVSWLEETGGRPLHLREPGGTPLGERLRTILLDRGREEIDPRTEALLFFAARAEMLHTAVGPALEAGRDVVCERFTPSTLAYQGQSEDLARFVLELDALVIPAELQPDRVLILDLDPRESMQRIDSYWGPDAFESRGLEFQLAVRRGYARYAAAHPDISCMLEVDGLDADQVEVRIRTLVEKVRRRETAR